MFCVVFCGGKATRLGALAAKRPKFLVPVAGKPFGDRLLSRFAAEGVSRVLLLAGHLGEQVREFAGDGSRWGLSVACEIEDRPLGTLGALKRARALLPERFLLTNGDSYLPASFSRVFREHDPARFPVLMTVRRSCGPRWRHNACVEGGRVTRLEAVKAGQPDPAYDCLDYGLMSMRSDWLADAQGFDLNEALSGMAATGLVQALEVTEPCFDIGTPEGIRELEGYLSGTPGRPG